MVFYKSENDSIMILPTYFVISNDNGNRIEYEYYKTLHHYRCSFFSGNDIDYYTISVEEARQAYHYCNLNLDYRVIQERNGEEF